MDFNRGVAIASFEKDPLREPFSNWRGRVQGNGGNGAKDVKGAVMDFGA